MPDPVSFRDLMADIARAQQMMEETHAGAPPSPEKDLLGEILRNMERARAEAEKTFPEAVRSVQQGLAETEKGLAKAQQEIAESAAKLDAAIAEAQRQAEAPKAAPAAPPAAPPDLDLGEALREELLDQLDQQGGRETPHATDIWEAWE